MKKPKCILLKLLNTPPLVKVRIIGDPRKKGVNHYVVKRSSNALGWEVIETFDEYEEALEYISGFFGKQILYK